MVLHTLDFPLLVQGVGCLEIPPFVLEPATTGLSLFLHGASRVESPPSVLGLVSLELSPFPRDLARFEVSVFVSGCGMVGSSLPLRGVG